MCHPEAQPKDLGCEQEILRFAQNDSFAVTLESIPNLQSEESFVRLLRLPFRR
jgi:hypothetical protein